MANAKRLISIVTPCFNETLNVRPCRDAVRQLFDKELAAYDYEHIFCDNASQDDTVALLKEMAAQDPHVKVIVHSRNFGAFNSMFNGMLSSSGDAVVCFLPADLQDPPEVIREFVRKWEEGYEIVYGIRKNRQEGFLMRSVRRSYYRLVSNMANITIPENVGEFQLVDRKVIAALRQFDDYYPYVRGMIASCGFRTAGVEYTWLARQRGYSKNRLYHLIDQGLNGLISFTNVPMRLCLFAGFGIALMSLLVGLVSLIVNLVYYRQLAPPGIPLLIVALFFFSGVQLFFLGAIGEYVSAIHSQVRKRPLVIERERVNFAPPTGLNHSERGPDDKA